MEVGNIYFVRTNRGNWLFKYKDGEYKTTCSRALCIDDMWSDGQANRNYIAMFNHIFEDEQE